MTTEYDSYGDPHEFEPLKPDVMDAFKTWALPEWEAKKGECADGGKVGSLAWALRGWKAALAYAEALQGVGSAEHSAIYISNRLTGSDADASFIQAHINQAVSEAVAADTRDAPSAEMTDEQIFAALKSVDPNAVRLPTGFRLFALAILQAAARDTASADALDAQRYRFIRATTKAIRDDDGTGRVEVTPEQFDEITDKAIAASAPKGDGE